MSTYKVVPYTYRGEHNELVGGLKIAIGDKFYRVVPDAYVWGEKQWHNGGESFIAYSRIAAVMQIHGIAYRIGARSAKPLKLATGESLESADFCGADSFDASSITQRVKK
jgi:hypothetical protein